MVKEEEEGREGGCIVSVPGADRERRREGQDRSSIEGALGWRKEQGRKEGRASACLWKPLLHAKKDPLGRRRREGIVGECLTLSQDPTEHFIKKL